MLLWIDGDAPPWGTVCSRTDFKSVPPLLALELGPTLAQNVRAGLVFMAANVPQGYGMRQDQFLAAIGAFTSEQLLGHGTDVPTAKSSKSFIFGESAEVIQMPPNDEFSFVLFQASHPLDARTDDDYI